MPDLTPAVVEGLEALEKAATPGEWQDNGFVAGKFKGDAFVEMNDGVGADLYGPLKHQNAKLIAAARNALPQLLALAKEHLSLLDAMRWREVNGYRVELSEDRSVATYLAATRALGWPGLKDPHAKP
jgi:hypothetical protein